MKKKILIILTVCLIIASTVVGCKSVDVITARDTWGTKVRVGYMSNYGSLWSVLNAIELGYMRDEGINVELIEFEDGPSIINAIKEQQIDIGYIGNGAHKLCVSNEVKIFALSHISNADAVIGNSNVNSIKDLKGKLVAYVENTSSEDILVRALKKENMEIYDVVGIRAEQDDIVYAMKECGIDAVAIWSPYTLQILEEVEGTKILADNLTFSDETIGLSSWVTSDSLINLNRGLLVRFTKALFKAMDYSANEHYEETAKLVAEQIGSEQEAAYSQRGDARWLTGREVSKGVEDGSVYEYYELQRKGFEETDASFKDKNVNDYVVFDIMIDAGEYK